MTIDAFLDAAWTDHADRPQAVADRLASSFHLVETAADIVPFARLLTHVHGEHLAQWDRGVELLAALRDHAAFEGNEEATAALDRNVATLRVAGGDASVLDTLSPEDRAAVLASVAAALAGRGDIAQAIDAFDRALAIGRGGLPTGSPAVRALAVGANNLAVTLEGKPGRTAAETRAMVDAAEAGVTYWTLAGTWLEEERAEYRMARSLLQASEPHAAVAHARRCVAICDANAAPPFERLFAHEALAMSCHAAGDLAGFDAHRAVARACLDGVPDDDKSRYRAELDVLDVLRPAP